MMKRPFGNGEVAARMGGMTKMARTNVSGVVESLIPGGAVAGLADFVMQNNLDDRATNDFLGEAPEVQLAVMARGDLSGTRNPSSALLGRIRDAKKGESGGGKGGGAMLAGESSLLAMLAGAGVNEQALSQASGLGESIFDQSMAAALSQAMAVVPNVVIAFVAQSVPDQGYSLVAEDLANPTSNVYILSHEICNPGALSKAKAVAFQPSVNDVGQLVVTGPVWLLVGKLEDGKHIVFGQCIGSLGMPSGNGDMFVRCPEVKEKFGRAAYVFSKVGQVCGLEGGDEICFDIHVSPKGLPQVSAPVWVKHVEGEAAQAAARAAAIGPPPQAEHHWAPQAKGQGKGSSDAFAHMKGKSAFDVRQGPGIASTFDASQLSIAIVKSSFPDKGFSLLTCDPSTEGNEIYIHKTVASPWALSQSSAVAFNPHTNAKSQLQASGPVWLLLGTAAQADTAVVWGSCMGTIVETSMFGDGFVHCPEAQAEYGSEPFIFRKVMTMCGLQEGDEVCFDVHLSATGKPQVAAPIWKKNITFKGGHQEEEVDESALNLWISGLPGNVGKGGMGKGGKGKGGSWQEEDSWQGGKDSGKGGGKGNGKGDKYQVMAALMMAELIGGMGDDGGWGGGGWGGGW